MHTPKPQSTKDYKRRQDAKGFKQIQVWVPANRADELKRIARNMCSNAGSGVCVD